MTNEILHTETCGCKVRRTPERTIYLDWCPLHKAALPELLATCERMAERECEYGNGANCNMLPQGVIRSVCLPCKARAAIAKAVA